MIAVHTALYIFNPKSSAGEGGLYPYRKLAYAIWISFPILTASLAFVNDNEAYVAQRTFCYLPVRPFWYRLALSWIPRYVIFLTIVIVYVSIYFYVRLKFRGFENGHSQGSVDSTQRTRRRTTIRRSAPPPALALNGFVTEPRRPSAAFVAEGRKQSVSTLNSLANMRNHAHQFMWTAVFHSHNRSNSASPPSEVSTDSYAGASTPQRGPEIMSPVLLLPQQVLNSTSPPQFRNIWRESIVQRFSLDSNGSFYTSPAVYPNPTHQQNHSDPGNLFDMHLVDSRGPNLAVSEMIRTREKICRQLRFLFIYPLIYLAMWIIPFVSHILQFNDDLAVNPPFALSTITAVCVCVQGALDCWLFSTREKPWKHIPGTGGTFFGSLKFWVIFRAKEKEGQGQGHGPGKTGNEMAREARQAYKRRDEELAQRRSEAQAGNVMVGERGRGDRTWWDVAGVDVLASIGPGAGVAAMTPVQEEFPSFMEEIGVRAPSTEIQEKNPADTSPEDSEFNEKGKNSNVETTGGACGT